MDDVFEDDREKQTCTLNEYLDDVEERELEAEMVLGGDDGDECTYSNGYLKRQAIFSCLTCTPEEFAGFCTACSLSCHEGHEVVELWTKRNFRCDCGNSKFGNFICKLQPGKDIENVKNAYNHNFKGTYCTCDRPYPDPAAEEDEEMVQCCICEDWFHREHLGLDSTEKIPVDDEGEPLYEDLICSGCSKACSFLAFYPQNIFVAPKKHEAVTNGEKGKGVLVEASCISADKISCDNSKSCDNGDIKPDNIYDIEGSVAGEKTDKKLSLNKCIQDSSSGTTCQLGLDLREALPTMERNKTVFLRNNWRDSLCRCEKCYAFYEQNHISFLVDKDDTIAEYEKRGKQRRDERLQKQEGATLNMFNNLGHIQKVEIMSGIAEMKNEMENFFANRDASEAVTSDDIYQLFDNLKKKRRREM
ncbi:uncharacterized protein LOC130800860 [Amaranthus tricolor]|uniref:uncharacterized protein LOC130800860 n=1 Tax=Amaranthus tricolor TaxID=29722 RepID=UPI00258C20F1|nr:uncharacterized protein LOC130800860 [Amaranthus tricolor]